MKYFWGFVFFLLLSLAFLLRWEGIPNENVLFLFDSSRDAIFAKNIITDQRLYLIGPASGGITGYFHGVFWLYIVTIPFILGQGSPIAFTIFMAVCSFFSVFLAIYVMRKIANTYAAVFAGLLYGFGLFNTSTSRYTWNPFPIVWLMPLYFLFFYWCVKQKKHAFIALSFITSLFIHFEAIYGICLLVPLLYFGIDYLRRKQIKEILFAIGVFLLPILPSILFDLRHHFLIAQSLFAALSSGGETITHRAAATPFLERIVLRSQDFANHTLFLTKNIFVDCFLVILCVIGILKHTERKFIYLIVGTLIIPFLFFLFLRYDVWSYYWIGNAPLYALLLSLVVGSMVNKKTAITLSIIIFFAINPIEHIYSHRQGYVLAGATTLSTMRKVTQNIYTDAAGQPFSVYVITPPIYDYTYQYLFWYEGKGKTRPSRIKQKTVYIIIEEGDSKFLREKTLRIKEQPVKTVSYPGIKVEKYKTTELPLMDATWINDI